MRSRSNTIYLLFSLLGVFSLRAQNVDFLSYTTYHACHGEPTGRIEVVLDQVKLEEYINVEFPIDINI